MNGLDALINTALIGTDKLPLQLDALPVEIKNAIVSKNVDLEEQVLIATTLLTTYNNTGILPNKIANNYFEKIVETKAIAGNEAFSILQNIETTGYYEKEYLCNLWLDKLIAKNEIVQPQWIMPLLNLGISYNKATQLKITKVVGETGKLILPLKADFKYKENTLDKVNIWKEGNTNDRKLYIEELFNSDSKAAIELIKNEWNTESISFKKSLLEILIENSNNDVVHFLENLYQVEFAFSPTEKITVTQCRKLVTKLLLQNKESVLWQNSKQQLSKYVIAEKKGFFQKIVSSANKINFNLPTAADAFFNSDYLKMYYGIEPKNNNPAFFKTDVLYWLSELVEMIPLEIWLELFDANENEKLQYFLQNEQYLATIHGQKESIFLISLKENFKFCKSQQYIIALMNLFKNHYDLSSYLTKTNFENYVLKNNLFEDGNFMYHYPKEYGEWTMELSKKIIESSYNLMVTKQTFMNDHLKHSMAKNTTIEAQKLLDNLFLKNDNSIQKENWINEIYKPLKKVIEIKLRIQQY